MEHYSDVVIEILIKLHLRNFPGGPAIKTPRSQCGCPGSIPGQGTGSHMHAATKRSRMPQLRPSTAKLINIKKNPKNLHLQRWLDKEK